MAKVIKTPFANEGDKTQISEAVEADNKVSMAAGYTPDYDRNLSNDPSAKAIGRGELNWLFNHLTSALLELQTLGFSRWDESGKPYQMGAYVGYGSTIYVSQKDDNESTPSENEDWKVFKPFPTATDVGGVSTETFDNSMKEKSQEIETLSNSTNQSIKTVKTDVENLDKKVSGLVTTTGNLNNLFEFGDLILFGNKTEAHFAWLPLDGAEYEEDSEIGIILKKIKPSMLSNWGLSYTPTVVEGKIKAPKLYIPFAQPGMLNIGDTPGFDSGRLTMAMRMYILNPPEDTTEEPEESEKPGGGSGGPELTDPEEPEAPLK